MNNIECPNKIRVSIIEPVGGHGGNDIYIGNICRALNDNGCMSLVFTSDETQVQNDVSQYFVLCYRGIYGNGNKYIRGLRFVFATFKALKISIANRIQIAHVNIFHFNFRELFTIVLFKLFRLKIVATIHDVEPFDKFGKPGNISRLHYMLFNSLIDLRVFHNNFSKKELLSKIRTNKEYKSVIVSGALDSEIDKIEEYSRIPCQVARTKLDLIRYKKIILFFGQIKKVKGLDLLIEAFAEVVKEDKNVGLVIAGKVWKDEIDIYQGLITKYHLENSIEKRIQYIPSEDVPYYFRSADLIVLPYKKIYNSGVFIRAVSYSRPVLCSDLELFKELVVDGKDGWLFKNGDINDLSNKIKSILKNRTEMEDSSLCMLNKMFGQQSLSLIGTTLKNAYKNIINGK